MEPAVANTVNLPLQDHFRETALGRKSHLSFESHWLCADGIDYAQRLDCDGVLNSRPLPWSEMADAWTITASFSMPAITYLGGEAMAGGGSPTFPTMV
jgi:hypothetical protein